MGNDFFDQIDKIAKILGSQALIQYINKLGIKLGM